MIQHLLHTCSVSSSKDFSVSGSSKATAETVFEKHCNS